MNSKAMELIVWNELLAQGLHPTKISTGEIQLEESLTMMQRLKVGELLKILGTDLLINKKDILIHRTMQLILEIVYTSEEPLLQNLSMILSTALGYDYTYLSNTFSEATKITIERFYISRKIKRAEELMKYEGLNLTEIADLMHYSSVSHLSRQFKKVTGITPTQFKKRFCKKEEDWKDIYSHERIG